MYAAIFRLNASNTKVLRVVSRTKGGLDSFWKGRFPGAKPMDCVVWDDTGICDSWGDTDDIRYQSINSADFVVW